MEHGEHLVTAVMERPVHTYTPRGTALEAFHCRAPELLLSGPAGTGKSRAALEKLHLIMLRNAGARGLIVRKVRDSLSSTGLVTWREHVVKEALDAGVVSYYGGSASEPPQYRYWNGSRVMIGGMDKPTKVMSSEYDMIYVQEGTELTVTDWESLTTRLRNGKVSFQQLIADANPDAPTHWLKQRADRGDTVLLHSKHEDNPVLFDDDGQPTQVGAEYLARLDRLTGVRYDRLRHGRWVAAEGLVYDAFDPTIHLRKIVEPPDAWTRIWSVDFGYTNPFVLQCWAVDPDGRLYLYRELYRTRRLVEDHARDILAIVTRGDGTWKEPKPRAIVCDHDAEDRATLERHLGMSTVAAIKNVSEGIQAVQARMKVQDDGRPRIYLSPTALVERDPELTDGKRPCSTLDELPGYVWDIPTTGAAAEKPPKEHPVKRDDHGMDALRYAAAHFDLAARPRVRWL
jgi:PBSX family phage terminase large subunit